MIERDAKMQTLAHIIQLRRSISHVFWNAYVHFICLYDCRSIILYV